MKNIEYREYLMRFDEPVNVYNERYAGEFPCMLLYDHAAQRGSLRIPDCGGMVDSEPASTLQQQWMRRSVAGMAVQETWTTEWEYRGPDIHAALIALLEAAARLSALRYTTDAASLSALLRELTAKNLRVERIIITTGSEYRIIAVDATLYVRLRAYAEDAGNGADSVRELAGLLDCDIITEESRIELRVGVEETLW